MGDLRSQCSVLSLEMLNTEQAELVQCQGGWDVPLGYAHLVKRHVSFFTPHSSWSQLVLGLAAIQSQEVDVFLQGRFPQQADQFP